MKDVIDEKDKKILQLLQEHADYPTRKIAKKTLLPITTVHNRIQKLKKQKVIKKFTVEVAHDQLDEGLLVYILIHVSLPLLKQKKRSQYDVANDLKKFNFVKKVDIVSGGSDLVVTVRVKDVKEYDKILLQKIQLVEGIEKTQSLIAIHQQ